jgi:hypothetical protein
VPGLIPALRSRWLVTRLLVVFAVATTLCAWAPVTARGQEGASPVGRDPWQRPFRSDSIWNMPIGDAARYVAANLPPAGAVDFDPVILLKTRAGDPVRKLVEPGSWTDRCSGRRSTGLKVRVPDGFLVADAQFEDGSWSTPNNIAAFLEPDGRTLLNTNALARCEQGGSVFGYATGDSAQDLTDLYGDGRRGSRGGSGLSGMGGALRAGELDGSEPIRHALDLLVWSRYLWWGGDRQSCFRWPALHCDGYADAEQYAGDNPALRMGSLLAIPPGQTLESVGVRSPVGRRLFRALQDYGAYVTDDSAWDAYYLGIDRKALGSFRWSEREIADVNRMVRVLQVVDDNAPSSIGGGGERRRAVLPELPAPSNLDG